ncbi:4'-phosphopantetheinyl transferase family protein [Isoptericola jiangsuensis]|uniref:4'-phosphopantetheinyl transferase family protein n=1 Tax=Isoptericola jiangsuensis TaxID=548579 RepID=UPI003AAE4B5F
MGEESSSVTSGPALLPAPGLVHVWWVPTSAVAQVDRGILSASERERESRLLRAADRDRFVVGAALVRRLAGLLSGTAPGRAVVERRCRHCDGDHGPPRLPGVEISVTHAGGWVGLACARDGLVGLDVEEPGRDLTELAGTVLAPDESCTTDDLTTRWTRKEAVLKATGLGLTIDPRAVVVEELGSGPRVVRFDRWPDPHRWTLHALEGPAGYPASLATWSQVPTRVIERWCAQVGETGPGDPRARR